MASAFVAGINAGMEIIENREPSHVRVESLDRIAAENRAFTDALIIEDEPHQAAALAVLLRADGYRVTVADSAREASLHVCSRRPDIVVADVKLRGTNLVEFLRWLRDEHGAIPTILVTGLPRDHEAVMSAFRLLACTYLQKPVDIEQLLSLMERACYNVEAGKKRW